MPHVCLFVSVYSNIDIGLNDWLVKRVSVDVCVYVLVCLFVCLFVYSNNDIRCRTSFPFSFSRTANFPFSTLDIPFSEIPKKKNRN